MRSKSDVLYDSIFSHHDSVSQRCIGRARGRAGFVAWRLRGELAATVCSNGCTFQVVRAFAHPRFGTDVYRYNRNAQLAA